MKTESTKKRGRPRKNPEPSSPPQITLKENPEVVTLSESISTISKDILAMPVDGSPESLAKRVEIKKRFRQVNRELNLLIRKL